MMLSKQINILLFLAISLSVVGCQRADELGPIASAGTASSIREVFASGAGDSTSSAEVVASGTGWATLKGRFVFEGTPPEMSPYNVNKDQATCTINGKAPLQETLLVDSATKGIANVAIYLRKASRVHDSAKPKTESVLFDQKECIFLTHVLATTVGQPLELKNSDNVGHNTNIDGQKNDFNQTIPAGESIEYTPKKEEATPAGVACSIHPWMRAYLLPRENGYVDVTKPDGTFEIANLPAGEELEIRVWHESAGGRGGPLVLKTDQAKELNWSKKGQFKIKLAENEERTLDIVVPAAAFGG